MATTPDQPWSNHEKNYLLAELIKAANPPPDLFFGIIRQHNIQLRWEDIPLPPNRSLNSCRNAFDELRRSLSIQPMAAPFPPPAATPISTQSASQAIKRPFPFESSYSGSSVGSGREIRPKPLQSAPNLYTQPSPTEPPPKRKRGRPTKAEALAKAEAAAAAGPADPRAGSRSLPPIQTPSSTTSSAPTLAAPAPEDTKAQPAMAATTTRMPIAAMLTPTARDPKSASQSSSSSGKRRRARSNRSKSDAEETPVGRSSERYESPYGRMGPGSQDSPARAAVLRHRDDPSSASRTAPSAEGTKESEPH